VAAMHESARSASVLRAVLNFGCGGAQDIGHGDLGIFGHPTSRTPWLDKMASEGAKLTMYESGANVCSPSRASIMTGRYYTRTGAYPGVFSPNSVGGLPLNETTIAKALIPAGYTSGMVGKVREVHSSALHANHPPPIPTAPRACLAACHGGCHGGWYVTATVIVTWLACHAAPLDWPSLN
jgi:hypothetical protein